MPSTDKEKRNEQARNRRKNNPEKIRKIARRSYAKNKKKATIRMANWREENIDKAKEISNDWKKNNPEKSKSITRQSRYRLTEGGFNFKLAEQHDCCAVCLQPFITTPHVDHDHGCCSGKKSCGECLRGLLCKDCNLGLGRFKDNTEVLERAIQYLKRHKESNVRHEKGGLGLRPE